MTDISGRDAMLETGTIRTHPGAIVTMPVPDPVCDLIASVNLHRDFTFNGYRCHFAKTACGRFIAAMITNSVPKQESFLLIDPDTSQIGCRQLAEVEIWRLQNGQ
ncbi:hypothetical protein KAR91_50715 [Candidatus Pacearchaeota archaeon]|nr:hypothetical protein [Candidatus Pacearchaeota archaeon]